MSLSRIIKSVSPAGLRKLVSKVIPDRLDIREFEFNNEESVRHHIETEYNFSGDLLDIFEKNTGVMVHKWHHYIPIYDRYFSKYRGEKVRFLEIGVQKGGSLRMWRKYFGEDAIIYGIDIDQSCARYNGLHGEVRIGSQTDAKFLASVVEEMGGVDVVLDDGSHQMPHVFKSLKELLKAVSTGGVYMIEDLHTAYWSSHGGGITSKNNFFNTVRILTDDIHHWYHKKGLQLPEISNYCHSIHVYDSITVIERGKLTRPTHSQIS